MTARLTATITTTSGAATQRAAAALARALRPPLAVLLDGDLGAGKTTFAQGFVAALPGGAGLVVQSPTFALARTYPTTPPVHHLDLYRLDDDAAARELGLLEMIEDDEAFALIEWPRALAASLAPDRRATIALSAPSARKRVLSIDVPSAATAGGALPPLR